MSNFFNQLINLGEEQQGSSERSDQELASLNKDELQKHISQLQEALAAKQSEYDTLKNESLSIQTEYDAYKRKVDGWQREMQEARAADRKMIEELRSAGASGGTTDEVYVKSTSETIANLKEKLRESHDENARAYQKQREAEEQRAASDEAKHRELEELTQKFDTFKERSRVQKERHDAQLEELRRQLSASPDQASLSTQLEASERQRAMLQTRCRSLEEELMAAKAESSAAASPGEASPAIDATTPVRSSADSLGGATPSTMMATLQEELDQARLMLRTANTKETELTEKVRKAEDRLSRAQDDAQWETLQAEKKLAELRSNLESWKTKHAMLESKLSTKESEHAAVEKGLRKQLHDAEDALTSEKERVAEANRRADEQKRKVSDMEQVRRETEVREATMKGEAEEATRRTSEALEIQRKHFEEQIAELDQQVQEGLANRSALEASIADLKEDLRRSHENVEDLRREVEQKDAASYEAAEQLTAVQRALEGREEDLLERERERFKVRSRLKEEEDANGALQSTVRELEQRLDESEHELRKRDTAAEEATRALRAADEDSVKAKRQVEVVNQELAAKERQVNELSGRLRDQGVRNADVVKIKEEQVARQRYYEHRITELQEEVRSAQASAVRTQTAATAAPIAAPQELFADGNSMPHRFAASIAHRTRGMTWPQLRYFLSIGIALIVLISFFGTFGVARKGAADMETLEILREKYGQVLASSTMCRESLADAKTKLLACKEEK